MIKGCNWGILVFTLVSFSMAQAQQFDIIQVGPQVQNPYQGQQAQQPAGQGAVPFQPMGPTQYLTGRQIMLPQNQQTLSSKPGFISVAKETVAETVSAFEKYVFSKTIESREKEAGTTQGAIAGQPITLEEARTERIGTTQGAIAGQPITLEEARAKGIGTTQGAIAGQPITLEEARAKGMLVRQFGYDLFSQPPSTFAPVEQVSVGPDYILGPDDEIRIAVWGKFDGQWVVRVDRNGNITVPKIGVLGVTGLTFQELKELLNREFSKYFTGFEMNVSLGSLRSIGIYVVGNANCPGSYTISSLATLVNALIEAGGPSKIGTMRDIQLKRNGKTLVHFDMYDLLLKGDKTKDAKLMPEDVIFIPPIGPLAAMLGDVKNPAIYELKNETALAELIQTAGGLSGLAFKGRVQIKRTEGHEFRSIFESNLVDIEKNKEKNLGLKDWDIVTVFSVAERYDVVRITGAVASPGELGIVPGVTTVRDVITKAGGLLYYASQDAEVTRVKVMQSGPVTERFTVNLAKALAGDPMENVALQMNDYMFVRAVPDWQLYRTVTVSGEVRYPGVYTIRKGEPLSSLIERAGGYTEYAYPRGAVFTRERVRKLQQRNLEEIVARMERELLVESSTVTSTSPETVEARKIELQQKQAFIESLKKARATGRLTIRLAHLRLLKGSSYDIELENNDALFIPMNNKVVNVVGAVMSNASVIYTEKTPAKDYIRMAGGYSRYADTKHMYVLKVDGSARKLPTGLINWRGSNDRWELTGFEGEVKQLEAGDTIVVPEKLERIAWLREIKDITQILAQLATAVGILYLIQK
jgi:protein involved in polysaccharide export with SLBB domain